MKRIQRVDLIDGPILPALLSFAFPILLSNIFQQLYNTSDVMIVGRFLGQKSLAAVGATSAIFDLIVGFAVGVGNGMGIIIARNYGAKNEDQLRKSVAATAIIGGILSLFVIFIGAVGLFSPAPIFRDPISNCVSVLSLYLHYCQWCGCDLCL